MLVNYLLEESISFQKACNLALNVFSIRQRAPLDHNEGINAHRGFSTFDAGPLSNGYLIEEKCIVLVKID